jgi:hypothetical protein
VNKHGKHDYTQPKAAHHRRKQSIPEIHHLTYSHFVNQMKDPAKVDEIVTILGQRLKHLKQKDLEELRTLLP